MDAMDINTWLVLKLIACMIAFQIKHFLVDFPLQNQYEINNKGTYGHIGGMFHSAKHAAGTFLIAAIFLPVEYAKMLILITLLDYIIHYHIDYLKSKYNKVTGITPADKKFWIAFGVDQLLHQLTMVFLIFLIMFYPYLRG